MSRASKILIGVLAGLFLLCCVGAIALRFALPAIGERVGEAVEGSVAESPDEAAAIAEKITDFDEAPTFDNAMGMSFLGIDMVTYNSDGGLLVSLMQFPASFGTSRAQMESQLRQSAGVGGGGEELESRTVTIRGEETTAVTYVTFAGSETEQLQLTVPFTGKNGVAMLLITGSRADWDEDDVQAIIDSLR